MRPIAVSGSACTASFSPVGPCVGVAYGRIATSQSTVVVNGLPAARVGDNVFYNGLVFPYWGGITSYSWVGKVSNSGSAVYVEGLQVANLGTPTDSGGFVISGESGVLT